MAEAVIAAVVLAGGTSRRFGTDKLAAEIDGRSLLDRAVSGLPADWLVIIVGPERPLGRACRFVREDPPGGGPGAALITGVTEAALAGAAAVVTLPGDAPNGGTAAGELVARLYAPDHPEAVVAVDAAGVEQPLQLAVRGAALDRLVARPDTSGLRARALLTALEPFCRLPLAAELTLDVDTPDDLRRV